MAAAARQRSFAESYALAVTASTPNQFAITLNPLNFAIGRYALNLEYEPALHHSVIVTPHYDHYSGEARGDSNDIDTLNGLGAELGYRFYTGSKGFDGFFAGPSLLFATGTVDTVPPASQYSSSTHSSTFESVGVAFDIGAQLQFRHLIIGIGAGVQYVAVRNRPGLLPLLADFNVGDGMLPRVAFNLGYAL